MTDLDLAIELNTAPRDAGERTALLTEPGFGRVFTDHMATAEWTADGGWSSPRVQPYGPLSLDPATSFMHYGQAIFEGFKAYGHEDGGVHTFRPEANGARFQRSAARLGLTWETAPILSSPSGGWFYFAASVGPWTYRKLRRKPAKAWRMSWSFYLAMRIVSTVKERHSWRAASACAPTPPGVVDLD